MVFKWTFHWKSISSVHTLSKNQIKIRNLLQYQPKLIEMFFMIWFCAIRSYHSRTSHKLSSIDPVYRIYDIYPVKIYSFFSLTRSGSISDSTGVSISVWTYLFFSFFSNLTIFFCKCLMILSILPCEIIIFWWWLRHWSDVREGISLASWMNTLLCLLTS